MLEMSNYYLTEMAPASAQVYGFLREFGDKMYGLGWDGLVAYQKWDYVYACTVQYFTMIARLSSQLHLGNSSHRLAHL
jgi:hypothetical protein